MVRLQTGSVLGSLKARRRREGLVREGPVGGGHKKEGYVRDGIEECKRQVTKKKGDPVVHTYPYTKCMMTMPWNTPNALSALVP